MTKAAELAKIISASGVVSGVGFTAGNAVLAEAELELLDGLTAGTAIASKVITTDANIDSTGMRNLTISGELDAATLDISGNVDIDGTLETDAFSIASTAVTSTAAELNILDGVTSTATELNLLDGVTSTTAELNILDGVTSTAAELNILDGVTSTTAELNILDGVTSTTAELNILDGVTSTAAELNILDGVTSTATELNLLDGVTSTTAELNILDGVTSTAAELNILDGVTASATDINLIDGITNGTVIASKAIITDSNKDITGGRNITISGELDAATLDISGDIDVDGTTNLDVVDIDGALTQDGGAVFNEASADVDFRVESNGNANMFLVDGGNNRVGIGTATPASLLEVSDLTTTASITIRSDRSGGGNLQFADQDDINVGYISYQHNNNRMVFRAGDNQQVYIDAAGCLLLGTTSPGSAGNGDLVVNGGAFIGGSAAANKLDDYEEGTWTPTSSCTGGNGSLGHASQVGHYTKVGNMVNITCYMSLNSVSGASGEFRIAGVPFTSKNATNAYITGGLWMNSTISGQIFDGDFNETLYLAPNDTTIRFFAKNGAGAFAQLNVSHLGAGSDFMVNITYRV